MVLPNRFPFQHPASPGGNFPPIAGTPLDEPGGAPGGSTGRPFPVGSVFMAVVSTNPATLLGYGSWTQIAGGRVLIGENGATYTPAEGTGGSASVAPGGTVNSESSHAHSFADSASSGPSGTVTVQSGSGANPGNSSHSHTVAGTTGTVSHSHSFSGGSGSTIQPYLVVYIWKRTA